jgi:hypothetical protein
MAAARRAALVALLFGAALAGCTDPAPPVATPVVADPMSWAATVGPTIDRGALLDGGLELPEGANVLAARIFPGGDSPAYVFYEAGGGAFSEAFYPASTIKLLAALGALDFARGLGLTGDAVVDGGYSLREIYDGALRLSSNEDYDELVRIAGIDRLNRSFLPAHGYPATAIQQAYSDQVAYSPEMVLTEGEREVVVPEREGQEYDYGCEGVNCSNLFELADAVRRVMLDAEVPPADRFDISPADVAGLQDALAGAEGFIAPGVAEALSPEARIYTKPGWAPELDCVEAALVADPTTGHRFLVAVSAPDDGSCDELAPMARDVLRLLDHCGDGTALRADGSHVKVVDGRQSGVPVTDSPVGLTCNQH